MSISVTRVPEKDLLHKHTGELQSPALRKAIEDVRLSQTARYGKQMTNAELASKNIAEVTLLSEEATLLLNQATDRLKLSARSYFKLIKIARTIADLEKSEDILAPHMAEALQYRRRDVDPR
jgi:magnesium chelatase family protein